MIRQRTITITSIVALGVIIAACLLINIRSLSTSLAQTETELRNVKKVLQLTQQQRCSQEYTWKADTRYDFTIESSGGERTYTVHTPKSYTPDVRYPIVVAFDGISGSAKRAERESRLATLPALTVFPNAQVGTNHVTAWQGAPYSPRGVSDIAFLSDLLTRVSDDYCVNEKKTYLVGMSNGAGFAVLAACALKDRIRAAVGISGAYYTGCLTDPEVKVPLMLIHSEADANVPFSGNNKRKLPDVKRMTQTYGRKLSCEHATNTQLKNIQKYQWTGCDKNSRVELIVVTRQPHGWLSVSERAAQSKEVLLPRTTSETIWSFFTSLDDAEGNGA